MSQSNEQPSFVIGPFTKENFNINKWKLIGEKIYRLSSINEEETIPYCQEFLQLVLELNQCEDYNEYFGDPSIKQFFFQEVFGRNAKNLIATRTFNDNNLLDISNSTLLNLVKFWVKAFKEDDPHLADMAKIILDPQQYYYKSNNLEYFSSSSIVSLLTLLIPC